MSGWISLHRQITNNWLYKEKRVFSKLEAWIDILLKVNHKDNKVLFNGQLIEIKRGERITSIRSLGETWCWSNTKVKLFLKQLELEEMLCVKSDSKKTLITVLNYDKFQDLREENVTETTVKRHRNDSETSQKHTNNNDNNDNNDKQDINILSNPEGQEIEFANDGESLSVETAKHSPEKGSASKTRQRKTKLNSEVLAYFDEFWKAYPKKKSKAQAETNFKKLNPDRKLLDEIIAGVERAKLYDKRFLGEAQYIPHPSTWLNARGWEDELEDEFIETNARNTGGAKNKFDNFTFGLEFD